MYVLSLYGIAMVPFRRWERPVASLSEYAAERVTHATRIAVEIVRKPPDQVGFAVRPRRWMVERCFAWLNSSRRFAADFETTIESATTVLYAAAAMLLVRRIARCTGVPSQTLRAHG